jgi:S-DNA-T family DNA segregation ATPase FtsK/SpoIIIE
MDMRYRRLNREGFENLSARFLAGKTDIPFYVIVFDEFADLILAGNEEKKEFEKLVARLASKGRAAGIHLVLTTQRPDSKIVTGLIKANLPLKICLRVTSATNSQIISDQNGGESLLGRGDLLCNRGKGIERAQSPYISQEELLQYLNGGKAK